MQISIKYKIPFIDFSKDSMSYNKEYFYNATHLNKKGADLFTEKLIKKIKNQQLLPIKE
jgi:lysophospholipase L1-like esterase